MEVAIKCAWRGTVVGVAALVIGLAVLVLCSAAEVLAHPGLSLEDGYWIGRQPWTGIGEVFMVGGATAAAVLGTATVWLGGDRWRRATVVLPLGVAAFYWIVAMLPNPNRAPCSNCGEPVADPFTYAYSVPTATLMFLLLPAVVIAVLAFTRRPGRAPAG